MGGNSAEHNHLFLISKMKQPNHRKIDPQLVTGTTCYLHTPFTYLPTLGHLIFLRVWRFCFKPWWFTRSLRTSFLRDLWLSESPLERGLVRKVQGFLTSGGLLGWCPWLVEKKISINCNGWSEFEEQIWGDEEKVTTLVLFFMFFSGYWYSEIHLWWFVNNYWELRAETQISFQASGKSKDDVQLHGKGESMVDFDRLEYHHKQSRMNPYKYTPEN